MAVPTTSRPLWTLDDSLRHFLLCVCVADAELAGLGVWEDRCRHGLSPQVWCRRALTAATGEEGQLARRLADLLDLKYLERVFEVRAAHDVRELFPLVHSAAWGGAEVGAPGLLWALLSDARGDVHRLGQILRDECFVFACGLVRGPARARHG